jgi:hypothetical protein
MAASGSGFIGASGFPAVSPERCAKCPIACVVSDPLLGFGSRMKSGRAPSQAREVDMLGAFRHRAHPFGGLFHTTLESAVVASGALLMLLTLLIFYFGLLAMK